MSKLDRLSRLACAAVALLVVPFGAAQAQAAERSVVGRCEPHAAALAEYETFVTGQMAEKKIPGLTVGFSQGDCTWIAAFGYTDLENRVPARIESAYRYASVQKSMTAVAVLQLVEQGRVDLDAEVQRYVPYFPRKPWPVTVRQLLGHLGGIPHYVNRAVEQHIKEHKTTQEAVAIFAGFDLVAEPGTRYSYSSYGYVLLGAAIEGASGTAYQDYMRRHVWAPAGMSATRLDDPLDLIANRVRGYQLVGGEVKNSELIDVSSRFAAGGARGTVPDLLRFLRALNEGKLLSRPSLELMYTPMSTRDGQPTGYAMGWQIPPVKNRRGLVMNDGGQQETRTFILNFPEKDFVLAFGMNLEADIYAPMVLRLYQVVLGEPLEMERR